MPNLQSRSAQFKEICCSRAPRKTKSAQVTLRLTVNAHNDLDQVIPDAWARLAVLWSHLAPNEFSSCPRRYVRETAESPRSTTNARKAVKVALETASLACRLRVISRPTASSQFWSGICRKADAHPQQQAKCRSGTAELRSSKGKPTLDKNRERVLWRH